LMLSGIFLSQRD